MVSPVNIPDSPTEGETAPVDENPAQSIKEILEQRMIKVEAKADQPQVVLTGFHPYRRAIANGVLAALLVVLLLATLWAIKTLE